jgi:RNA polymerase sigma factor (sigma-70 family)
MAHESDAEDAQLLRDGDIASLLAKYDPIIVGRCVVRLRGSLDAEDVAQNVRLRMLVEFKRGKRYEHLPYRVVVQQVITWTLGDYFEGRPTHVPLPEDWDPPVESGSDAVISMYYLDELFDVLPERTRRVLALRYLRGLEHEQIAKELGMTRNAVDQALHRGHAKLREALTHG